MEHITEGRYEIKLKAYGAIKLSKYKKDWMKKVDVVLSELKDAFEEHGYPDIIQIEDTLSGYKHGASHANIIITLARFNGTVSWGLYRMTKKYPNYIHPVTARKKVWGNTFHYLKDSRKKKEAIVACVVRKYPYIINDLPTRPKAGGFADVAFDITDAITIGSCVPIIKKEE